MSIDGLSLRLGGKRLFLPFEKFPWFRDAPIGKVCRVEQPTAQLLRWPELDIDILLRSIAGPDTHPLAPESRPPRRHDA